MVNGPSHRRLALAMGLSAVAIFALLELLAVIDFAPLCTGAGCTAKPNYLSVRIERPTPVPIAEITLPEYERRELPEEQPRVAEGNRSRVNQLPSKPKLAEALDLPANSTPVTDWYEIARTTVSKSVDKQFKREETRASMWRSTASVMFRDTGEFDVHEPATIIAAREFRVPLGVLGIGFTIGGCFFGIPLAGIPVENRSVGPTVFYCADIYE